MITGVETAGLTLACFPLAAKAVKSWLEGIETLKTWRKARREMSVYHTRIESQRVFYLNTLEWLLADIVTCGGDMKDLLDKPGGELWRREEFERSLQVRLDRSYEPFVRTLEKVRVTALCDK